jgi:hypothetical protein
LFFCYRTASEDVVSHLGLTKTPFPGWSGGELAFTAGARIPGVHTPFLYVSGSNYGAPFTMHVEDHYLYLLSYLYRGASKFWIVVPPAAAGRLQAIMERYVPLRKGARGGRCSQFMRHVSQWVSLGALKAWSIPYTLVEQRPGDLIVTAPCAYHQGWNSGANVAEAVNWGDGCSQQRLADYKACRPSCVDVKDYKPIQLQWQPSQELALYTANDLSSYFEAVPVQPSEKPWKAHDMFGDILSPLVVEHLFDNGRDKNKQLVGAMFAMLPVLLLFGHAALYSLPDLHKFCRFSCLC